jgi:glutamate N-acetyltransferase/amino-acid N-acetyltransferase
MAVGLKAPSGLLPVRGVRLAAGSAGIYRKARPDLALIAIEPGSTGAAVFTSNTFCAAPVRVARAHLAAAAPRYCLINAGNANAGTGSGGIDTATATCRALAAVGSCATEQVLPFSTGVIGEPLPADAICRVLPELHARLSADAWMDCAAAIMTTDTLPKGGSRTFEIDGRPATITGIAKGAGMIHPDLATMLVFIATDAVVDAAALRAALDRAADRSFNRISVDGDTSTNDAVVLLATGHAGNAAIRDVAEARAGDFVAALEQVCTQLAHAIVRDGEGATKFIAITVEEGADEAECLAAARAIARSPLVKTAFFASDPNWGRILAAVGNAGLRDLDGSRIGLMLDEVSVVERGERSPGYTEQAGCKVMSREEITVRVKLGRGGAATTVWTCDFSHEYVRINAEYRS